MRKSLVVAWQPDVNTPQRKVRRSVETRYGVAFSINKRNFSSRIWTIVRDALCSTPAIFMTRSSAISSARPAQIAIGVAEVNTATLSFRDELIFEWHDATRF